MSRTQIKSSATASSTSPLTRNNLHDVTGPEFVQTIRGQLFGKQVSLICCGESHHEILDLTRVKSVVLERRTWIDSTEFGEEEVKRLRKLVKRKKEEDKTFRTRKCNSPKDALKWGEGIVKKDGEEEEDGIFLIWEHGGREGDDSGLASLYIPDDDDDSNDESDAKEDSAINDDATKLFLWADDDGEARALNNRRVSLEETITVQELDKLIEKRKENRIDDGRFECWDDWMLRMISRTAEDVDVEVVMEASVPVAEVELHYDSHAHGEYPLAHTSVQRLECDSDEDSEDEDDPDDGTGAALDYFLRRLEKKCVVHRVDPRSLGDFDYDGEEGEEGEAEDVALASAYQELITQPLPGDSEMEYLTTHKLGYPPDKDDSGDDDHNNNTHSYSKALPSWEGYFGASSELLYYSPHVKADYTPFLSKILQNPKTTDEFFQALYFGTVDEALKLLNSSEHEKQGLTCTRSLVYRDGKNTYKRPGDHHLVPVRYAPINCYLKARNSDPPRTWISALQSHLLRITDTHPDAKFLLEKVRLWYQHSVRYLLQDPKNCDRNGDYFSAYLRAVHRDIYDDIDRSDPEVLRRRETMPSLSKGKKKKHKLRDIEIPSVGEIFDGWKDYDPETHASTARERVLSQIIVDAYQLRMVDVSAIITVARCVASAKSQKIVLVLYMGNEHTQTVLEFFQNNMGFSITGLTKMGLVGKMDEWDDDDPRALTYPDYLHDFELLFPVPVSSIASKKKKKKKKKKSKK